jgi:hypothetical protein
MLRRFVLLNVPLSSLTRNVATSLKNIFGRTKRYFQGLSAFLQVSTHVFGLKSLWQRKKILHQWNSFSVPLKEEVPEAPESRAKLVGQEHSPLFLSRKSKVEQRKGKDIDLVTNFLMFLCCGCFEMSDMLRRAKHEDKKVIFGAAGARHRGEAAKARYGTGGASDSEDDSPV